MNTKDKQKILAMVQQIRQQFLTSKTKLMTFASLIARRALGLPVAIKNVYAIECIGPDGKLKWADSIENIVVNEGLDEILNQFWTGSAYTASHFVLLTDGTPTVAPGDTMAAHPGWVEITAYTEGTRQALTMGAVSGQSIDNSASKASFSINATATVGGAGVTTDSTKGGATGLLIGAAAFTQGDKPVDNGDTLNVTVTSTAATA